jgi:ABC-2 type transport system permease protein
MLVLMALINIGMAADGEKMFELLLKPLTEHFFIQGNLMNGNLIGYLALNMLWVHIPVLLVIVTADMISGELESGTIRNMLCSAWTRKQWLFVKIVVIFIYIFVFMLFSGLIMTVPSLLLFGSGDLLLFFDGVQVVPSHQVIWRFCGALLFGTIGMLTFAGISVMFSVLLRSTLAAILASLGILVVSTLLQTFGMGIFDSWKPLLFTFHMAQWQLFFAQDIDLIAIVISTLILLAHFIVVLGISFFQFNRMNITE